MYVPYVDGDGGVYGWAESGGPGETGSGEEHETPGEGGGAVWGGGGGEWERPKFQLGQQDQFCPSLDQVFR